MTKLIKEKQAAKDAQNNRLKARGNFWQDLPQPIIMLAPMADVTDAAFRQIIAKYGKPDVMWTEFVSADGLFLALKKGREILMKDLMFTDAERPIVAQFFTSRPEMMEKAAALALELGFDGIDINMGCPDRSIEKQGAGAALIKTPALARELIKFAKRGATLTDARGKILKQIPVSVKTRIGWSVSELEKWLPELLTENPAAITIHARTRKEMSRVPARWEEVKRAVEIRNLFRHENGNKSETLIFGNGDITDLLDAKEKIEMTGAHGAMIGRAIFGNPWLFSKENRERKTGSSKGREVSIKEKLEALLEHTLLFEKLLGRVKNFAIMKKHFKAYVHGWDGAKELRLHLMNAETPNNVKEIISSYLKNGLK